MHFRECNVQEPLKRPVAVLNVDEGSSKETEEASVWNECALDSSSGDSLLRRHRRPGVNQDLVMAVTTSPVTLQVNCHDVERERAYSERNLGPDCSMSGKLGQRV